MATRKKAKQGATRRRRHKMNRQRRGHENSEKVNRRQQCPYDVQRHSADRLYAILEPIIQHELDESAGATPARQILDNVYATVRDDKRLNSAEREVLPTFCSLLVQREIALRVSFDEVFTPLPDDPMAAKFNGEWDVWPGIFKRFGAGQIARGVHEGFRMGEPGGHWCGNYGADCQIEASRLSVEDAVDLAHLFTDLLVCFFSDGLTRDEVCSRLEDSYYSLAGVSPEYLQAPLLAAEIARRLVFCFCEGIVECPPEGDSGDNRMGDSDG